MRAILSIDGGGVRGIIPARFLAALEAAAGQPCAELFDLVAGTSTGGILALGLTRPGPSKRPAYAAADLVNLYRQEGARIFSRSPGHVILTADGVAGPKYEADGIESVLQQYFAGATLGEALAPVLVTTYDTRAPGPVLLRSWAASSSSILMRDAARATSAAPTYFAPLTLGPMRLIDGGVFANHPGLCAWACAREALGPALDVAVVSIGTGNTEKRQDPSGWGLAQWAPALVDVFMDGTADAADLQLRALCPRYYRFQADLAGVSQQMDDATPATLDALMGVADKLVGQHQSEIEMLAGMLASRSAA